MIKNKLMKAFTMLTASTMMLGSLSQTAFAETDSQKHVSDYTFEEFITIPYDEMIDSAYDYNYYTYYYCVIQAWNMELTPCICIETSEKFQSEAELLDYAGVPMEYIGSCEFDSQNELHIRLDSDGLSQMKYADLTARTFIWLSSNQKFSAVKGCKCQTDYKADVSEYSFEELMELSTEEVKIYDEYYESTRKTLLAFIRHNYYPDISATVINLYDTPEEMMSDIGFPQKYVRFVDGGCGFPNARAHFWLSKNGLTDKEFANLCERLYVWMHNNPKLHYVAFDFPAGNIGADLDTNGDGNVDISDASEVMKYYSENHVGIMTSDEDKKYDINGDNTVSISDASYILKYYAESAAGLR